MSQSRFNIENLDKNRLLEFVEEQLQTFDSESLNDLADSIAFELWDREQRENNDIQE